MARKQSGKGGYERDPETAARDAEACRLRAQNYTYDQIAERLGLSNRGHAYKSVQRALKDIVREPAEELRSLELERLDELASTTQQVIYSSEDPDVILKAVDRHLKIQTRRAALLGLDAPAKAEVSGPGGDPISMMVADFTALPPEARRARLAELNDEVSRRASASVGDDEG